MNKKTVKEIGVEIAARGMGTMSGIIAQQFAYKWGTLVMPIPNDKARNVISTIGSMGICWAVSDAVTDSARETFRPIVFGMSEFIENPSLEDLRKDYDQAVFDAAYYNNKIQKLIEKEMKGETVEAAEYANVFETAAKEENKEEE